MYLNDPSLQKKKLACFKTAFFFKFFKDFLMWTTFKVFTELVPMMLLFYFLAV